MDALTRLNKIKQSIENAKAQQNIMKGKISSLLEQLKKLGFNIKIKKAKKEVSKQKHSLEQKKKILTKQ